MDHDDIEQIDIIIRNIKGEGEEKQQKNHCPEENYVTFEERDVLIVIPFHVHGATSIFSEYWRTYMKGNLHDGLAWWKRELGFH